MLLPLVAVMLWLRHSDVLRQRRKVMWCLPTSPQGETSLTQWTSLPKATSLARKGKHRSKNKSTALAVLLFLEAPPGIGPGMKVLQTSALPLGYGAVFCCLVILSKYMRFVKPFFFFCSDFLSGAQNRELKIKAQGVHIIDSTLYLSALVGAKANEAMKSCFAGWNPHSVRMKSSAFGFRWNQIRLSNPALAGFHRAAISSTNWIYSDEGGFSWKRLKIASNLESFSWGSILARKITCLI